MNKILTILILYIAIAVAVMAPPLAYCSFANDSSKYQNLFYPNGMPTKKGPLGVGPTAYKFYSEVAIPEKFLFVLYSVNIKAKGYQDYKYNAFLSILDQSSSVPTIISTIDVTNYMTKTIDECDNGCFQFMAGKLEILPLINNTSMLHLSVGSILSYRQMESSESDVFFRIDVADKKLIPILTLLDTLPQWQYKDEYDEYYNTLIYFQMDQTTGANILTQKYSHVYNMDENVNTFDKDPNINVYTYDINNDKYVLTNTITALPADVVPIPKITDNPN